jgi:hypothetical protein
MDIMLCVMLFVELIAIVGFVSININLIEHGEEW